MNQSKGKFGWLKLKKSYFENGKFTRFFCLANVDRNKYQFKLAWVAKILI